MNLLERLDVPANFERIRALEEVVEATAHNRARPSASIVEVEEPDAAEGSPRPNKRVRLTPEPIDWAEEVAAFSARNSPEPEPAVSLDGSDDEDVDEDLLETIGYYADENRYAYSLQPHEHETNLSAVAWTTPSRVQRAGGSNVSLNMHKYSFLNIVNKCEHNVSYETCRRCKGKKSQRDASEPFDTWILDSGASFHFTHNRRILHNVRRLPEPIPVSTANGLIHIKEEGDATLTYLYRPTDTLRNYTLRGVHLLPNGDDQNLLSFGWFLQNGFSATCKAEYIKLYDTKTKVEFMRFTPVFPGATVYKIVSAPFAASEVEQLGLSARVSHDTMHKRFAHPGDGVLKQIPNHTLGSPEYDTEASKTPCPGCAQGKMPNRPFPATTRRATKAFELVHSDLKQFPVLSYHRYEYVITFVDDYSSHAWITCLRKKSAAIKATEQFLAFVETQHKAKVQTWMSDAGGEYKSDAFDTMLKDRGIKILTSVPHTPQQNGRAERFNRTMMDKAEALRFTACIPESWWEFAVQHAVMLYNRTPLQRLKWSTPFEALHGEKLHVDQFRVFGCGAWVFIPADVRKNKLQPKSEMMTYIGNDEHGWIFMRAPNNVVFRSTNMRFVEDYFPKCPDNKGKVPQRPKEQQPPEDDDNHSYGPADDNDDDAPPKRKARSRKSPPSQKTQGKQDDGPADAPTRPQSPRAPLPETRDTPAPGPSDPELRRGRRVRRPNIRPDNAYGDSRSPAEIIRDIEDLDRWEREVGLPPSRPRTRAPTRASTPVPDIPPPPRPLSPEDIPPQQSESGSSDSSDVDGGVDDTFRTAPPDDSWDNPDNLVALCREGGVEFLNFLLNRAVPADQKPIREWTYRDICRLPPAAQKEWRKACTEELNALKRRDVYELVDRPKHKRVVKNRWVFDEKSDGRKKARLVARGFSQIEGVDYDQIFSPVVRFETVRLMLALAALEDMHLSGLDVRNAYLYGDLEEEIYMEQPEGFTEPGKEHMVLRLRKALYGLKQAGLAWWRTLKRSMTELGFTQLKSDAGIYVKYDGKDRIIVIVYVDDAIFAGRNKAKVLRAKESFMKRWECRDLGDVQEFLRMRIRRHGSTIKIDQCAYLDKVLERFGMTNCKPKTTPLPEGYMPKAHEGAVDPARRQRFQTVIGSLLYLMLGTRPDIAFSATKLAQHSANPSDEHLDKALNICRYLQSTREYTLEYDGASGQGIIAFTDADFAGDAIKRRSQTGYVLRLAGASILWSSYQQKSNAFSTKDAEYMALSDCSRDCMWIQNVFHELGYKIRAIPICSDNQGALFVSQNPVTEKRTKHIDVRYHYIRDVIDKGAIEVYFVPGVDNPADIFTKNLGPIKIRKFREELGLHFR